MTTQLPSSAQEIPLLRTKLFVPPCRPELVPRPRLIERLNAGPRSGRKLTLISAPAGSGKTTLISEWVASHRSGGPRSGAMDRDSPSIAVAWLSLDESDNDLTRFLSYVVAALQTVEASIGKGVLSALHSPQPPPAETILTALINEIAALACRIVLVLDDHHLIEAQPIHDALAFLLRRMPPQLHLLIATRVDPPLSLARLRARGQLTELRARDLRFIPAEANEFLNQVMHLDLSKEDIAALARRTEGWVAGLQLAAISIQGRKDVSGFIQSFTGGHHFVLDYLVEEVLDQQSESVRTFLLQTAILDRLTGPLCDALTGQDDGQATLEMLERANLFVVPLDDRRRWYRYHHLFADLLRQRLRRTQPEQVQTLHQRISEWHEQNGYAVEAIEHALRAEDIERAMNLIEEHVDAMWGRGEHAHLRRWLAALPVEFVLCRPQLCIFHAWYLFAGGQLDAAEQSHQAAVKALDTCTDRAADQIRQETSPIEHDQRSGPDKKRIQGRAAALRAYMAYYRGDVQAMGKYSRQALDYLPEQDLAWRNIATVALGDAHAFNGDLAAASRVQFAALENSKAAGNPYMILLAYLKLAITLRAQGRLQRTIEICQQQLQLAKDSGLSQAALVGCALAIWGETLAELGDLDGAIHQAEKGAGRTEHAGDLLSLGWSYLCLMRVVFSTGDLAGAQEVIHKLETVAREYDMPFWFPLQMSAWQARIWLAQNKLEAAFQWVQDYGPDVNADPTYPHDLEYMVLARILIAQERLDATTKLLQRWLEATEAGGRTSRAIEILMLQALASQARGDIAQAMVALERALALAEPEGFARIFVDEGPPMARLLYEALSREIVPNYVRRLLAAFPVTEPDPSVTPERKASESELIEPLSERELQVLQLFAEGLTNREVASRLFLTLNTVKSHSRNIYGKLNVHSRTQAVARAQALGLLTRK